MPVSCMFFSVKNGSCAIDDSGLVCWGNNIENYVPEVNKLLAYDAGYRDICLLNEKIDSSKEVICFTDWKIKGSYDVAADVTDVMSYNDNSYCSYNGTWRCQSATMDDYNQKAVKIDNVEVDFPPLHETKEFFLRANTSVTVDIQTYDVIGENLTLTETSLSEAGVVSINGKEISYTPALDFVGTEIFSFEISDGQLISDSSVSFTIVE